MHSCSEWWRAWFSIKSCLARKLIAWAASLAPVCSSSPELIPLASDWHAGAGLWASSLELSSLNWNPDECSFCFSSILHLALGDCLEKQTRCSACAFSFCDLKLKGSFSWNSEESKPAWNADDVTSEIFSKLLVEFWFTLSVASPSFKFTSCLSVLFCWLNKIFDSSERRTFLNVCDIAVSTPATALSTISSGIPSISATVSLTEFVGVSRCWKRWMSLGLSFSQPATCSARREPALMAAGFASLMVELEPNVAPSRPVKELRRLPWRSCGIWCRTKLSHEAPSRAGAMLPQTLTWSQSCSAASWNPHRWLGEGEVIRIKPVLIAVRSLSTLVSSMKIIFWIPYCTNSSSSGERSTHSSESFDWATWRICLRITFSNSVGPSWPRSSHRSPSSVMLAKSDAVICILGTKSCSSKRTLMITWWW